MILRTHKQEDVFGFCALKSKILQGTKIYGKRSLKLVPLVGWAWTFTESIFLKRDWEKDRRTIVKDLDYITAYPKDYWVTVSSLAVDHSLVSNSSHILYRPFICMCCGCAL